jgi:hypothetical protein
MADITELKHRLQRANAANPPIPKGAKRLADIVPAEGLTVKPMAPKTMNPEVYPELLSDHVQKLIMVEAQLFSRCQRDGATIDEYNAWLTAQQQLRITASSLTKSS